MTRWTRNGRLWFIFFGGPLAAALVSAILIAVVRALFLGPDVGDGNYLVAFPLLFIAALGIALAAARWLDPYESPLLGIAPLAPLFIAFIPEVTTLVLVLVAVFVAVSSYVPWLQEKIDSGDSAHGAG